MLLGLLLAGLLALPSPAVQAAPSLSKPVPPPAMNASGWKPRPATYAEKVTRDVPVTMSDGTVLRVDVYQPVDPATGQAVNQRFPVLLTQTPYNKSGPGLGFRNDYLV